MSEASDLCAESTFTAADCARVRFQFRVRCKIADYATSLIAARLLAGWADATIGRVNYELYMSAALSEAKAAMSAGDRADGAVAVLDEAMVARGHEPGESTGDPTAHAVLVVVREAARQASVGRISRGVSSSPPIEPCTMCVGALLETDVDGLVFAMPDPRRAPPARSSSSRRASSLPRRPRGRLRDHAARSGRDLRGRGAALYEHPPRALSRLDFGQDGRLAPWYPLVRGEVSEWLMVPLSKSGVRKHRGFESHPLRHSLSKPLPGEVA